MSRGRTLRILFATARYLPSVGGTEIHAHEVGTRLVRAGHRVVVLTADPSGDLSTEEEIDGVEVVRVPAWPKSRDYCFSPSVYHYVRQSGRDFDVLHCQGYYTLVAPLAMCAGLVSRLPYVLTFHGRGHSSLVRRKLRRPQELILRPLLSRAACLIALTEREKDFYRRTLRLPDSLFVVIPGGANLVDIQDGSGEPPDPDLIVSLGRAERLKGHQKIIAALPHITRVRPGITLRICGDGPFAPELRRLAQRLGVAERVEIGAIPYAQRKEFVRTIRAAALVVSLSDSEAQGLAALEAAYLGRPLLVTAAPGLTELVDVGIATGVPADATSKVLAKAVLDQLKRPMLPPSVLLPSWDDCANRLEDLYASVLRDRR
jgi:glycosyltransferase involved in cell wall biosynthesis